MHTDTATHTEIGVYSAFEKGVVGGRCIGRLGGDASGQEVGLYTILPSPILYGVWHRRGRSAGGHILRNGRAIVLQ